MSKKEVAVQLAQDDLDNEFIKPEQLEAHTNAVYAWLDTMSDETYAMIAVGGDGN